jgi:hypothetical protein
MQPSEFQENISKLKEAYGERNYPEIRVTGLWKTLSVFAPTVFTKAVDKLILTARTAPLYTELREQCEFEQRNRPRPMEARRELHDECPDCGFNGVIEMIGYLGESRTTTFGSCDSCELGKNNGRGGVCLPVSRLKQMGWAVLRERLKS